MISSANEQLLKSLLQVVDDFERAEKAFKEKNFTVSFFIHDILFAPAIFMSNKIVKA